MLDEEVNVKLCLGASFTCDMLADYIKWWLRKFSITCECELLSYDQILQSLIKMNEVGSGSYEYTILLQRFEDFIHFEGNSKHLLESIQEKVEQYKQLIKNYSGDSRLLIGLFEISDNAKKYGVEVYQFLLQTTNEFSYFLNELSHIEVLDFREISDDFAIKDVYDALSYNIGAIPYTEEFLISMGTVMARKVVNMILPMHKVIIVDCDNTLWSGECGNGTAQIDSYFLLFQQFLLEKKKNGYLLVICSKNNESDVMDFFSNSDMLLRIDDFVEWKINWKQKSENIREIAKELNLGQDSFIFIDDSLHECLEVMEAIPDILTIQYPTKKEVIPAFLKHIWALDRTNITKEDLYRTQMYQEESKRKNVNVNSFSFDEYVEKLGLEVYYSKLEEEDYERAVQLIQRTNQFNLSAKRRTIEELCEYLTRNNTEGYIIECSDKYGDYGISGLVLFEKVHDVLYIDTLLLSCRVLGRKVELTIIKFLIKMLEEFKCKNVLAQYWDSGKNKLVKNYLQESVWIMSKREAEDTSYILDLGNINNKLKELLGNIKIFFERKENNTALNKEQHLILFNHIGVAVRELTKAREIYERAGFACGPIIYDPLQKVNLCMCSIKGYSDIELVQPVEQNSTLYNLTKKNFFTPYHMCFSVPNIVVFLEQLQKNKIEFDIISEAKKAVLFDYKSVIFLYISDVGVVELLEENWDEVTVCNTKNENQINISIQNINKGIQFFLQIGYEIDIDFVNVNKKDSKSTVLCYQHYFPQICLMKESIDNQCAYNISSVIYKNNSMLEEEFFLKTEFNDTKDKKKRNNSANDWNVLFAEKKNTINYSYQFALKNHTGESLLHSYLIDEFDESPKAEMEVTDIESGICNIVSEVLKIKTAEPKDNYLAIGGDSLKAVSILSRINKKYNLTGTLEDIFLSKNIREFVEKIINNESKNRKNLLKKVNEKGRFLATESQKRIFMFQSIHSNSVVYNMPRCMYIIGKCDTERIEKVFAKIIYRYQSLRINFEIEDGILYQYLRKNEVFKLSESTSDKSVDDIIKDFIQPFNLCEDSLFRVAIVHRNSGNDLLLFDVHHIVVDGISLAIIVDDFVRLYDGEELEDVHLQFLDYVDYENKLKKKDDDDYWLKQYSDGIPQVVFPSDYKSGLKQSYVGEKLLFKLPANIIVNIKHLAIKVGTSLNSILFAAYGLLLSKYIDENKIIISVPISNRKHIETENVVGLLVNVIPIILNIDYEKTVLEYLQESNKVFLRAYEHPNFPYETVIQKLQAQGESGLFRFAYIMQNMENKNFVMANVDFGQIQTSDFELKLVDFEHGISKYDISIEFMEQDGDVFVSIEYCSKLFMKETIEQLYKNYLTLMHSIIEQQEKVLNDVLWIKYENTAEAVLTGNTVQYQFKTILEAFARVASLYPDNIAISDVNKSYQYSELDKKSDEISSYLITQGIREGEIVALLLDRTSDMGAYILGVMKAGAAYLPLSKEYPRMRIERILKDSGAKYLISDENIDIDVGSIILTKDVEGGVITRFPEINESTLAYVIYTSGTTGNPKGVAVEHRNILNYAMWRVESYGLTAEDKALQLLPMCFDGFCSNFYSTLLSGGEMVVVDNEHWRDFEYIGKVMSDKKITNVSLLPTMYRGILTHNTRETFATLRLVILAGEKTEKEIINLSKEIKSNICLINEYGATENTVTTTANLNMQELDCESIGVPIFNNNVCVLDKYGHMLPFGICGELGVWGQNLTRGYINDVRQTEEKFISVSENGIERLYRTGDYGRIMPNGEIRLIGRMDNQIKLRGYRIETSEIEEVLLRHPDILQSFVHVLVENDKKALCAFWVSDVVIDGMKMWQYLREYLPEYMIPQYYAQVKEIPMNQNGKIDTKVLEQNQLYQFKQVDFVAAENETEKILASICEDILGKKHISMLSDFISEGGQSLDVARLKRKIFEAFNVEIGMEEIFQNSMIKNVASLIDSKKKFAYVRIKKTKRKEFYPVSSAQRRIYLLEQIEDLGISYHIPVLWKVCGKLDKSKLQIALNEMVASHEILRTVFEFRDGDVVQKVMDPYEVNIEHYNIEEKDFNYESWSEVYQLNVLPLFRVALIGQDRLVFEFHHIIIDGVSLSIFFNELEKRYNSNEINEVQLQYRDYVQYCLSRVDDCEKLKQYWLQMYKKETAMLNYRTDYPRKTTAGHAGKCMYSTSGSLLLNKIKEYAKQQGITEFVILFAAYNIMLAKISNEKDIIVGIPTAGRKYSEVSEMLGVFLNTLAIRTNVDETLTWNEYVYEVNKNLFEAYRHEEYPFEELVQELALEKVLNRKPLFDVMFVMRNVESLHLNLNNCECEIIEYMPAVSKYDFTLTVSETDEYIFAFQYNAELFKEETIQRYCNLYLDILEKIIENPNRKLSVLKEMSKEELQLMKCYECGEKVDVKCQGVLHAIYQNAEMYKNVKAVVYKNKAITYGVLVEKIEEMSRKLCTKGIEPGDVVALCISPCIEMIIMLLSVMRCGAAYLPLDIQTPQEKLKYCICDSNAKLLVTEEKNMVNNLDILPIISILELEATEEGQIGELPPTEQRAYVIYTSGTTGDAKGVSVSQRNLMNYVNWFSDIAGVACGTKSALLSAYCFDLGYSVIYPTLVRAGELHLMNKEDYLERSQLLEYIVNNEINYLKMTPTMFRLLFHDQSEKLEKHKLGLIVLGGESLVEQDIKKFYEVYPEIKLLNHYGPTETTIGAIYRELKPNEDFTNLSNPIIGRPIYNSEVYILDEQKKRVQFGIEGEIYIAGEGVSQGYVNDIMLNQEKFVYNPFSNVHKKMYRTGDFGYRLVNGDIVFVGRKDNQIKLHGYRVDLQEVKKNMLSFDDISAVEITNNQTTNQDMYLIAYYESKHRLDEKEIQQFLRYKLNEYMIPARFQWVEHMPMNSNGKVDYKKLEECFQEVVCEKETDIETKTEQEVLDIWNKLLGINNIGVNDNFFDVGGNSILLLQLQKQIKSEMGIELRVVDLFQNSTIAKLSSMLDSRKENRMDLEGIKLPAEWLSPKLSHESKEMMTMEMTLQQAEKVSLIAEKMNVEETSIYIAIFIYILNQIIGIDSIRLLWCDSKFEIYNIEVEMNRVEDFEMLISEVNKIKIIQKSAKAYKKVLSTDKESVYFLFGMNIEEQEMVHEDARFSLNVNNKHVSSVCVRFDRAVLNESKIRDFLQFVQNVLAYICEKILV